MKHPCLPAAFDAAFTLQDPQIAPGGVVSAADFQPALAPGGLGTIMGSNLADATVPAPSLPLPVTMGGVRVLVGGVLTLFVPVPVGGIPAPLLYVSPTQINFQVPFATPVGKPVPVTVLREGAQPAVTHVIFRSAAPAIFTYARTPSSNDPVILHADNTLATPDNPAKAGEILVIYATGAGQLNGTPADGVAAPGSPPATTLDTPTVTVGGAEASVLFSGLTPGFVALLQINIQLPATLPPGTGQPLSIPLLVTFSGASSLPVKLWVAP